MTSGARRLFNAVLPKSIGVQSQVRLANLGRGLTLHEPDALRYRSARGLPRPLGGAPCVLKHERKDKKG